MLGVQNETQLEYMLVVPSIKSNLILGIDFCISTIADMQHQTLRGIAPR